MADPDRYVALISSLPHHDSLFAAKVTPLSRQRLMQRLQDLEPTDHALLMQVWRLVDWAQYSLDDDVARITKRVRDVLAQLDNPCLCEMIAQRFELRTLVAGLRRRHRGETTPPPHKDWGYGRWLERMTRYWQEPGFRLERVYPWVFEADRLLGNDDPLGLERLILRETWRQLDRIGAGHYFDFEAVVIYVMRWDLVDRWTRYDGEHALHRFHGLVEQGLNGYEQLFAG